MTPRPIGTSEIVMCKRCLGRGVYLVINGHRITCHRCGGAGKLKQTVVAHKTVEVIEEEPYRDEVNNA